MLTKLVNAPKGVSLSISDIAGEDFAARMARLGLYKGARLMRLDESVTMGPIKVQGSLGNAVLSGWLAGQVVIHLEDGRRIPLPECSPGDSGHVEGITGQDVVEESLRELGIAEHDRIVFLRRIPPMNYAFHVTGEDWQGSRQRFRMNEFLAAHVLGTTEEGPAQFSSVGMGENFTVRRILPGEGAEAALASMNVVPGAQIVLESVSISHDMHFTHHAPVACVTKEGLRLYMTEADAQRIIVSPESGPRPV